jgi:intracellular sulfur oxidation DsrE/DsrF family protein
MKFSEDMVNAYADGELQGSEKDEFEAALICDADLQYALDEVLELKSVLRSAYRNIEELPAQRQSPVLSYRLASYIGLFLLVFSSGWVSGDFINKSNSVSAVTKNASADSTALNKYILHIGTHDDAKFRRALNEAEALLTKYQANQSPVELEVIANAGGLDLFRENATPYAERIRRISQTYPNIRFIACSNAIDRLREKGIEPNLINTVQQGPTAIDQVVMRMNQGWSYIKI